MSVSVVGVSFSVSGARVAFRGQFAPLGGACGIVWGRLKALSICAGCLGRAMDIRAGQRAASRHLSPSRLCDSRHLSPSWLCAVIDRHPLAIIAANQSCATSSVDRHPLCVPSCHHSYKPVVCHHFCRSPSWMCAIVAAHWSCAIRIARAVSSITFVVSPGPFNTFGTKYLHHVDAPETWCQAQLAR